MLPSGSLVGDMLKHASIVEIVNHSKSSARKRPGQILYNPLSVKEWTEACNYRRPHPNAILLGSRAGVTVLRKRSGRKMNASEKTVSSCDYGSIMA
jgi:hypothetical protein